MKEKPDLKTLFAALQTDMVSKAKFSNVLNHPVDKGDNSEENWIKWFDDYCCRSIASHLGFLSAFYHILPGFVLCRKQLSFLEEKSFATIS